MQLETLFLQVSSILNDRPLSARVFSEDDFQSISPNDLLLGRTPYNRERMFHDFDGEEVEIQSTKPLTQAVIEKTEQWWSRWLKDVFPLLATRRRWQNTESNLDIGDIVLVKSEKKFSKAKFRLARVIRIHPDTHGHVRTVTVGMRNLRKAAREKASVCKARLSEQILPVQ